MNAEHAPQEQNVTPDFRVDRSAIPGPGLRPWVPVVAAALLAACGGGGSSDTSTTPPPPTTGNTVPPSSGPGDVESFFPNSVGNTWFYDSVTTPPVGTPSSSMDKIAVTGEKAILGQMASIFQDTSIVDPTAPAAPTESYYFKNAGGVAYMGSNDPADTISPSFAPYIEALYPLAPPATVANFGKSGLNIGDVDGDGVSDSADMTLTAKEVDFEALNTAVGNLPRTLRTTETLDGTITLSSNQTKVPFTSLTTTWTAPGIGVVKRTLSVTVQGKTQLESVDLRGYVVDGAAAGLTTPSMVAANLDPGDSDFYTPGPPAVAGDGTNFLVLGNSTAGLQGTFIDNQANVVRSLNFGSGAGYAGVAFDGTNYLVAMNTLTLTVHRVTPAGVDLDAPNGISVATGLTAGEYPAAASGTSNTLIVYTKFDLNNTNQHLLYGMLVDQNGQPLPSGEIQIAVDNTTHLYPQVSFDGTNFLVVWQQQPGSGSDPSTCDIYAARVSPSGAVLDSPAFPVSSSAGGQFSPVVAFDGTNYFVAWTDDRNDDPNSGLFDIYGARVAPNGEVLDPAGLVIDAGGTQHRSYQSIAFTGSEYLVAWADVGYSNTGATGIRLARMKPDGTVTSASGGMMASGPLPAATVSEYVFPVMAATSKTASLVWLNNTQTAGTQKNLLAVMAYGF